MHKSTLPVCAVIGIFSYFMYNWFQCEASIHTKHALLAMILSFLSTFLPLALTDKVGPNPKLILVLWTNPALNGVALYKLLAYGGSFFIILGSFLIFALTFVLAGGLTITWFMGTVMLSKKPCDPNKEDNETSQNKPLEIEFVEGLDPLAYSGKIGMCHSPGRKKLHQYRDLAQDLLHAKEKYQITTVVCLLEEWEQEWMEMKEYDAIAKELGLTLIRYPIRDRWIPVHADTYRVFIYDLARRIKDGEYLMIHCNGGRGRTGITTACLLRTLVYGIFESVSLMRKSRDKMMYNPLQNIYYLYFALYN